MKKGFPKRSTTRRVVRFLFAPLLLISFERPATAQTTGGRKWEIEFHGGGMLAGHPTGGTAALPGPGTPLTTPTGRPSRRVSSWYFGDGALLLNQTSAAWSSSVVLNAAQSIVPLDLVLNSSVTRRQHGGDFGVRVSRVINARVTVEATLDYNLGRLAITDVGLTGIEASRGSFAPTWNFLFAPTPFLTPTVTSTSTIHSSEGHEIVTTGVLNIALKTRGKVIPYVTGGGGVISRIGGTPSVSLVGNYQPRFNGTIPFNETDSVTVRFAGADHAAVAVIGGGFRYNVSPRWGVRWDVRAHLSRNSLDTVVDAHPAVATLTPAAALSFPVNPTVQLTNNSSTGAPGSLSGPPLDGFRTFAGTGLQSQVSVTTGIFWRF